MRETHEAGMTAPKDHIRRFGTRKGYYMHVRHVRSIFFLSRWRWFAALVMSSYERRFPEHQCHLRYCSASRLED